MKNTDEGKQQTAETPTTKTSHPLVDGWAKLHEETHTNPAPAPDVRTPVNSGEVPEGVLFQPKFRL